MYEQARDANTGNFETSVSGRGLLLPGRRVLSLSAANPPRVWAAAVGWLDYVVSVNEATENEKNILVNKLTTLCVGNAKLEMRKAAVLK